MRVLVAAILAGTILALVPACSSNKSSATPTPTAPATATASTVPASASPKPSTTPASTPSPSPSADGTVDPLGAGQTTPWTIKPQKEPFSSIAVVKDLRTGVHPENGGWERIVFEFAGDAWPPGTVQYVDKAVACGSGQPVAGLTGSAILEVAFTSAQSHDNSGKPSTPLGLAGIGKTVLTGAISCDFEGHVTWDFGLTGKQNFKVSTLSNPPRVVIDVKQ